MKNITINLSLFLLIGMALAACDDATQKSSQGMKVSYNKTYSTQSEMTKNTSQIHLSKEPMNIQWAGSGKRIPEQIKLEDPDSISNYVNGEPVKASNMPLDEFIKKHGRITLRTGEDFFADWSIELKIEDLKENTIIELDDFNTKVEVSTKKPKQNLPTSTHLDSIKGTLKTGKITALGMPVQMHVETKKIGKPPYIIDGQGFATIGDIKIKNNRLDKHYDSFKTIRIIAKYFVKDKVRTTPFTSRHVMYSSDKNVGVEALQVFSYQDENKQDRLVRVQLLKQADGWKAEKELAPWELLYSRKEGSKKHSNEIHVITSKKIEALLKDEKIENHIDTSVSCRQSKDKMQGLCTAKITVLKDDEKSCMTKAYSLAKNKDWKLLKEVATNLKLDYKTGKLVEKKQKKKSLEEKLFKSTAGFLFGKCSGF